MPRQRLEDSEIAIALRSLPHWRRDGNAIVRSLQFADFGAAFAFMTKVASIAETMQHHPDWHNCYSRVGIRLWTHDAGGITARDFQLAEAIDLAAAN